MTARIPSRIATVREMHAVEDSLDGRRILEVGLADGPSFDVLLDRGLDIGDLWFRGAPISWRSPLRGAPAGADFARSFTGGMLWTCGPDNIGPAHDGLPMHGSHHATPAVDTRWSTEPVDGDAVVTVTGTVAVSLLFGTRLVTRRTITAAGTALSIRDTVTNEGAGSTPVALLYHLNFGAPFLGTGTEVDVPSAETIVPREPGSDESFARRYPAASDSLDEHVYEYEGIPTDTEAALTVRSGALTVDVRWETRALPRVYQWVWPSSYGYALGIEPANAALFGPARERADFGAPVLKPGESTSTRVTLEFRA